MEDLMKWSHILHQFTLILFILFGWFQSMLNKLGYHLHIDLWDEALDAVQIMLWMNCHNFLKRRLNSRTELWAQRGRTRQFQTSWSP